MIRTICDIRFDDFGMNLERGDPKLVGALRQHVRTNGGGDGSINPYLYAAWKIRDNMAQTPSIDNFIDTHRSDPMVVEFGKISIAKAILAAEKSSALYFDTRKTDAKPDFNFLSETWLGKLFSILVAQRDFESFCEALSSISFVSFNYDRCIHQFLLVAAQQYFYLSPKQVDNLKGKINILYAYGSVGDTNLGPKGVLSFGDDRDGMSVIDRATRIRTFTEGTDSESRVKIQNAIKSSSCCVFVGFGFLLLNMSLLFGDERVECDRVVATVKGLSIESQRILHGELKSIFGKMHGHDHWEPIGDMRLSLHDMKAAELLFEYERFLSKRFASLRA